MTRGCLKTSRHVEWSLPQFLTGLLWSAFVLPDALGIVLLNLLRRIEEDLKATEMGIESRRGTNALLFAWHRRRRSELRTMLLYAPLCSRVKNQHEPILETSPQATLA